MHNNPTPFPKGSKTLVPSPDISQPEKARFPLKDPLPQTNIHVSRDTKLKAFACRKTMQISLEGRKGSFIVFKTMQINIIK